MYIRSFGVKFSILFSHVRLGPSKKPATSLGPTRPDGSDDEEEEDQELAQHDGQFFDEIVSLLF